MWRPAWKKAARAAGGSPPPHAAPAIHGSGGDVGDDVFAAPDFLTWFAGLMARPAAGMPPLDIAARRLNAAVEDRKAEAPCECCRRPMPQAGRCAECRLNGVWYCAACHDRLADLGARRRLAAAEDRKAGATCDGCRRPMLAAERCSDCRSMGLWFCAGCHATLNDMAGRIAARA